MRRKTTIYLDEGQALAIRAIALSEQRSQAEIVREAIDRYLETVGSPRPLSIGIGHSGGGGSIADKKREWLKGFGER